MAQNPRPVERESTHLAEEATRKTTEQVGQATRTMADASEKTARVGAEMLQHNSETFRDVWRSGTNMAQQMTERSAEWVNRVLGLSGNGAQDSVQQLSRNLNAILETSTSVAEGVQSVSREWMSFAQRRTEKNLDRIDGLFRCRTPHELMAAQTDLMRDNIEDYLKNTQRISEMTSRMAQEATRKMSNTPLAPH